MPEIASGYSVEVEVPSTLSISVVAPETPSGSVTVVPVAGPAGPAGPDTEASLTAHIESTTPHPNATSGRDFAAWYAAGIV